MNQQHFDPSPLTPSIKDTMHAGLITNIQKQVRTFHCESVELIKFIYHFFQENASLAETEPMMARVTKITVNLLILAAN